MGLRALALVHCSRGPVCGSTGKGGRVSPAGLVHDMQVHLFCRYAYPLPRPPEPRPPLPRPMGGWGAGPASWRLLMSRPAPSKLCCVPLSVWLCNWDLLPMWYGRLSAPPSTQPLPARSSLSRARELLFARGGHDDAQQPALVLPTAYSRNFSPLLRPTLSLPGARRATPCSGLQPPAGSHRSSFSHNAGRQAGASGGTTPRRRCRPAVLAAHQLGSACAVLPAGS